MDHSFRSRSNNKPAECPPAAAAPLTLPSLERNRDEQHERLAATIRAHLSDFFSGRDPSAELCDRVIDGITLSTPEGREWRAQVCNMWRSTENSALDHQRSHTSLPKELEALRYFDSFILPRLSKVIPPEHKTEFIEYGIAHLAWVGYMGFASEHHSETVLHAFGLIRHALPEGLALAPKPEILTQRLGKAISNVISTVLQAEATTPRAVNYDILDELLRLPLPWSDMDCGDAFSELYWNIRYDLDRFMDPADRVLLSDFSDHQAQANVSGLHSVSDQEFEGTSEFGDNAEHIDDYMSNFSEDDAEHLRDLNGLSRRLVDNMLKMPLDPNGDFWREFLIHTSLGDPIWALGVAGLEQCNPYEYEAIVYQLLHATAQHAYGARTLLALAQMDHSRTWKSSTPVLCTLREISQNLPDDILDGMALQLRTVASHYSYLVEDVIGTRTPRGEFNRLAEALCRVFTKN